MDKREFTLKLAKALKDSDTQEVSYFLAYLRGYLDHENEGNFQKLMLSAMKGTDVEKFFKKEADTQK